MEDSEYFKMFLALYALLKKATVIDLKPLFGKLPFELNNAFIFREISNGSIAQLPNGKNCIYTENNEYITLVESTNGVNKYLPNTEYEWDRSLVKSMLAIIKNIYGASTDQIRCLVEEIYSPPIKCENIIFKI